MSFFCLVAALEDHAVVKNATVVVPDHHDIMSDTLHHNATATIASRAADIVIVPAVLVHNNIPITNTSSSSTGFEATTMTAIKAHAGRRVVRQIGLGSMGSALGSRLQGISSGYGYGYNNGASAAFLLKKCCYTFLCFSDFH